MKPFFLYSLLLFAALYASAQTATTTWSADSDPTMSCFSSARVAYLDNDTILDIVVGGGYELEYRDNAVNAYSGATGNPIWQQDSRGQFFGSAIFQDITGDGIADVFINGRVAQLNAYNGATGDLIWEFYPNNGTDPSDVGWYNFYNMQWVPDQNGDQLLDILISNGGNHLAPPFDTINRPVGRIVLVSGGNGNLLNYAEVPDGRETYMSPLVHDLGGDGILDVIYGTGGEILYGNLWRTTIADILNGDISNSTLLAASVPKGFIPPPSLADVNTDGQLDIIIAGYNGKIQAIDGTNNHTIWQTQLPETETNASPTIGQFTDDFIPDIFISVLTGTAPSFLQTIQLMINGETGQIAWQDTIGFLNFATANAANIDQDHQDEIILSINHAGASFSHELLLLDFDNPTTITSISGTKPGTNLASTPWVGDLDNDGLFDIVYTHNKVTNNFAPNNGYVTERLQTNYPCPTQVAYGAYMGTNYDGKYINPYCQNFALNSASIPSPCANTPSGAIDLTMVGGTAPYIITQNGISTPPLNASNFSFQNLLPNTYNIHITDNEGCKLTRNIIVGSPPALNLTLNITQPSSNTAADGAIQASVSGGVGFYQTQISGNSFTNLPAGNYTITASDANGCTISQTITLGIVGVQNPELMPYQLKISPNPAQSSLNLSANTPIAIKKISLFDLSGKNIWQQNYAPNTTTISQNTPWTMPIDISHLSNGIYTLQLLTEQGIYTEKIIKE